MSSLIVPSKAWHAPIQVILAGNCEALSTNRSVVAVPGGAADPLVAVLLRHAARAHDRLWLIAPAPCPAAGVGP